MNILFYIAVLAAAFFAFFSFGQAVIFCTDKSHLLFRSIVFAISAALTVLFVNLAIQQVV